MYEDYSSGKGRYISPDKYIRAGVVPEDTKPSAGRVFPRILRRLEYLSSETILWTSI